MKAILDNVLLIYTMAMLVFVGLLYFMFFEETFILSIGHMVIITLLLQVLFVVIRQIVGVDDRARKINTLIIMLLIALIIACGLYGVWTIKYVRAITISRIVLGLTSLIVLYVYLLLIRAEQNYTKKTSNQRIQKRNKETFFQKARGKAQRKASKQPNDIVLTIGYSTDHEKQ